MKILKELESVIKKVKVQNKDLLKEVTIEWRGVNYKELCHVERSLT